MKEQSLVSIIIPTYNRAHLIGETLDSVLAQTYQNWECIVVDDGSTDDTDAVMNGYCDKDSRFKYFHRPEEHLPGGNGARNYGFKMSQGEYVNWFDSDDLMHQDKLSYQCSILLNKKNVDVVFSDSKTFKTIDSKLQIINQYQISTINFIEDYVLRRLNAQTGTALWRKSILNDFEYNETLKQSQDHDYYSRVLSFRPNVFVLNVNTVFIRVKHSSISSQFASKDEEKRKSFIKVYAGLTEFYKNDKYIHLSLVNILIKSLLDTISKKYSKGLVNFHIKKIDKLFVKNSNLSNYKLRWFFVKKISLIFYQLKGKGAYRFRSIYNFIPK